MATAVALALAAPAASVAQTTGSTTTMGAPAQALSGPQQDRMFMQVAASSDQFEIRSSEMAMQRAQSEDVRQYAEKMIREHKATTVQLQRIAQASPTLAAEPMVAPEHQAMLDRLTALQGPAFTAAYLDQQIMAHQQAVDLYQTQFNRGDNLELKAFAGQNLPHLRDHLALATELRNTAVSQGDIVDPAAPRAAQGTTGTVPGTVQPVR